MPLPTNPNQSAVRATASQHRIVGKVEGKDLPDADHGGQADEADRGATGSAHRGIREWMQEVEPREDLRVVTFDPRVHVRMLPGSAAKQAAIALRHKGFRHAERGESFWVGGMDGPLSHDEVVRARAWGAFLATLPVAV